jgi:hypothetical protein
MMGQNKESEKGRDHKRKKALVSYLKWTVWRQTKIENFHSTDTVLEESGGEGKKEK